MGATSLVIAASTTEKIIAYTWSSDLPTRIPFTLDSKLRGGTVLLWYDLPEVYVNQKRYIESKEDPIWGNFFSSYECDDAETVDDFTHRRPNDAAFLQKVGQSFPAGGKVHPCGLVALSMFTDEFQLHRVVENGVEVPVPLDETDLALPDEDIIYDDALRERLNRPPPFTYSIRGEGDRTWLSGPREFEHFKVWMRTSPSPHVRHLWATIDGSLEAGDYVLSVMVNSPVWTETWKVPEKRVVLSEQSGLGSKGAATFFGILCVILACVEVGMFILILLLPAPAMTLD